MKEYKDESGNTVREFSFEDWEEGEVRDTTPCGTARVRKQNEHGEVLEEFIRVLPKAEYDKIQAARNARFKKQVQSKQQNLKNRFYKGFNKSLHRQEYIDSEILRTEYILLKSAREKYDKPQNLNLLAFPNFPALYQQLVVIGDNPLQKDGSTYTSRYNHEVIALSQYLEWLKDLRKNPREAYQDVKYFWELTDEKLKEIQASHKWNSISREINEKGYMGFRWENILTKVYTNRLMYVIVNRSIELWNREKGKEEIVSSQPFRAAYADGFLAGEKYFEQKWQIDKAILSSPSAPSFIKSLLENYFKSGVKKKGDVKGWNYVKRQSPGVLSQAIFYDYGKHSGIVSRADEVFVEYAPYFEPYLEKQATSLETVNKPPKSDEQLALKDLFTVEDWQKYFDVLTMCEPKLLEKKDTEYKFVGNLRKHRGIVAAFIKHLQRISIVDQNTNDNAIARILSANIAGYRVGASTVRSISETYKKEFKLQFSHQFEEIRSNN